MKLSFYKKIFKHKPHKEEIGNISNMLSTCNIKLEEVISLVGEYGCTFAPAVFNGKRCNENYLYQQLVVLNFNEGITFEEVKSICNKYHLPILFAYKTFSYTPEHEKFRVVFYTDNPIIDIKSSEFISQILVKIFNDTPDKACIGGSKMFFGGKGLLYKSDNFKPINIKDLIYIELEQYFHNKYDEKHYKTYLKGFYSSININYDTINVVEATNSISVGFEPVVTTKNSKAVIKVKKPRRKLTRNFDWNTLKDCCNLYKNFVDGTYYYYYSELFFLATNLCNIDGGKKHFLNVLNTSQNNKCISYFQNNWKSICNMIINHDYQPTSCSKCIYANTCDHGKNMILTSKIPDNVIKIVKEPLLYTIEEAENSLQDEFYQAINSFDNDIHVIKAQTGLGKTNLYLNFLKTAEKPYIIAVPTNELKNEIYNKAISMGIRNIVKTPTQPQKLSVELDRKIMHMYSIGAGYMVLRYLKNYLVTLDKSNVEYSILKDYFSNLKICEKYQGHIITTHMNLLLMKDELVRTHQIIIDEDILKTAFSINQVTFEDISKANRCNIFSADAKNYLFNIYSKSGYQICNGFEYTLTEKDYSRLLDIKSNIVDLFQAKYLYIDSNIIYYIKKYEFPKSKLIIMSATAEPSIYQGFLPNRNVITHTCKKAKYIGNIIQYTNNPYSRDYLQNNNEIMQTIKYITPNNDFITFAKYESNFNTKYHFGGIDGLNSLEGHNITIVGTPHGNEIVYNLYSMIMTNKIPIWKLYPQRIDYKDCNFKLQTYDNPILRSIQLWIINSQLEQAVGRARLLRNNCTVTVFAKFPIEQAKYINSFDTVLIE